MSPHLLRPQMVSRGIRGVTNNILVSGGQGGDTDRGNGKQNGLLTCQRTKNHFPKRGKHKKKNYKPTKYSTTQNQKLTTRVSYYAITLSHQQRHTVTSSNTQTIVNCLLAQKGRDVRLSAPTLYSHQVSPGALIFPIARVAIRKGGKAHQSGERTQ